MCARPVDVPAAAATRAGVVHDVRVGRQGVYDGDRRLVGYELSFRTAPVRGSAAPSVAPSAAASAAASAAPSAAADRVETGEQATSRLLSATFGTFGLEGISDGKPVFVRLTRGFLTGLLPIPVEPDGVVIVVTDQVAVDHELLLGLAELRDAGFRIAVDDYRGDVARSVLVELADFVTIDVDALSPLVVPGLVQSCRQTGATLVAVNVADADAMQRCVALGFELFCGEYLARPAVLSRRVLSPSQLICVRLLDELADPDAPLSRIEQLVGSDPGLSLRLLRGAHSAAGAGHEVESLRQAMVLIGPRRLRSWVVITLLEGTATQNASDDLWGVLARAHACSRLAPSSADLAYTIGLLSGAAQLLATDVETVAEVVGVGHDAREALVDGQGPAGHALRAVLAHEREDDEAVAAEGFNGAEVSRVYLDALRDSLQLVHEFLGR
jgi:EAL and modified HD-GYP domain-containing signal transduction protein